MAGLTSSADVALLPAMAAANGGIGTLAHQPPIARCTAVG